MLIAGPFGFTKREFFEIEDAADREVPTVSFQPDAPGALPGRSRRTGSPRGRCAGASDAASALLAAALAALALTGDASAKSFTLPQARRLGAGDEGRQPRRRRAHHLRVQRPVQRRLPRHPAAPRARRSTACTVSESGRRLPPGRLHRARLHRRARHVRDDARRRTRAHRLALPGARRAAHVHGPLPADGRRGRLRRRRRREPQGLGLRVGGAARPPDGDRDRARQDPARPGATPSTSAATSSSPGRRCSCARSTSRPGSSSSSAP